MLEAARASVSTATVRFEQADLDQLRLRHASYDLAYSALTLHYLDDVLRFARTVNAGLRPGGRLVLTCEHPIFTAPSRPGFAEMAGRRVWPVDGYADEGVRVSDWLAPGVRKQHRTMGSILNPFLEVGMRLRRLVEWSPSPGQVAAEPSLVDERDRPMFLVLAFEKRPLR